MDNQSGQNKNRIIDVTGEHAGEGFQILSANKPKNDNGVVKKQVINIPVRKEVIIGFIFRIFVTVFLFLYGVRIVILNNEVTKTFKMWWLFRLVGVTLVFLSLYLLYNFFTKKTNRDTYAYWCIGFIFALIILLASILGGNLTLLNAIFIAF